MTTQPEKETLLVEYQVCATDISQLDNDIWQSGSVLVGLSVVGFTLLMQTQAQHWSDFIVYIVLSIFGLVLLSIWKELVVGWLRLVHINFFRMREIETELGMQREQLIAFMDHIPSADTPEEMSDALSRLTKELSGKGLGGPVGIQKKLSRIFWLIIAGWIGLLAKQLLYLLFVI